MTLTTLPRDAAVDAVFSVLERDGVVIVESVLGETTLASVRAELQPYLDREEPGGGLFFGYRSKRLSALLARSRAVTELILHPLTLALADRVLLPNCQHYQLQTAAVLEVWQGGKLQPLHRDEGVYAPYLQHQPGGPEYVLSFMWAVSEFTAANGATRVVPGSHLWEPQREASEDETVQAMMPRGSLLLWCGSVLHGMSINHTAEPRMGIAAGYSLGWLRQEENHYLAIPPEVARELSVDVQKLLGYRAHSPFLGWVGGRDPDNLLQPAARGSGYDVGY